MTKEFLSSLATQADINIVERDLYQHVLAHLTQQEMAAWMTPVNERTDEQKQMILKP